MQPLRYASGVCCADCFLYIERGDVPAGLTPAVWMARFNASIPAGTVRIECGHICRDEPDCAHHPERCPDDADCDCRKSFGSCPCSHCGTTEQGDRYDMTYFLGYDYRTNPATYVPHTRRRFSDPSPQEHPDWFTSADLQREIAMLLRMNKKYGTHVLRVAGYLKLGEVIRARKASAAQVN